MQGRLHQGGAVSQNQAWQELIMVTAAEIAAAPLASLDAGCPGCPLALDIAATAGATEHTIHSLIILVPRALKTRWEEQTEDIQEQLQKVR